ncbi:sugar transporter [Kitasatospora herbaricolor]|uniref:sugar porter family MFS transporter n=1 Tax=Kitasatospora herbaricolor TaxID=68217 RepID=UPI00174C21F5|nr:sugar porter family MFS transporter [Kitasatospora herbaricolor]MDQ0307158.1 SP family sugar:H+ symporter-like MFS transporter [Kitasatospora herbaricolor]GGV29317.1 sugar transporter [Kitasatospora herbaricolor]
MATTHPPKDAGEAHLGHVVFISAAAAMGGFLFGYDSAVINGAVTGIQKHFEVGNGETAFVVAIALLGSAAGAVAAGWLADHLGRVRTMLLAAVLFAISGVGSMFPPTIQVLALWRVVGGVAIGIASVIAPTYIAEVAPTAYRGRLASFQQMAIVLGITVSQLANYALNEAAGGESTGHLAGVQAWQWMLGVETVPALVYGLMALAIPESPRFLIAARREDEAREVLREVEGEGVDLDARVTEIRAVLASTHKPRARDLLGGRFGLLPIVWIGIGASVFQQFVGINVIFYYSSFLWQSVGIDESNSLLISLSTSIVNVIGTVLAMTLVDRIGRKPLALAGSAGMAISLGVAAWAFSFREGTGDTATLADSYATTALVAAHVFVFCFAFSWGVVVWVLLGEMFPNRIRALALSVAASAQWIANWAITVTFPDLADWNLSATYVIYAFFALLSIPFVAFCIKETKGRTLESMG